MRIERDATSLRAASEATLADRIARERRRRGWSQERLAKEVSAVLGSSFPQSAVSKLERGPEGRTVSAAELVAFGQVFEVDPLALMLPDDSAFDLHQVLAALGGLEEAMVEMHHAQGAVDRSRDRLLDAAEAFVGPLKGLDPEAFRQVMQGLERVGRRKDMQLVWATVVSQLHLALPGLGDLIGPEAMGEAMQVIRRETGVSPSAAAGEAPVAAPA